MSLDFYNGILDLGANFDQDVLEKTRALARSLPTASSQRAPIQVDTFEYGPHERHRADIFWREGKENPVLVFVPGGGFVAGCRLNYRSFGEHFARLGYVVAIMDYRLAPMAIWPSGAEDVTTLVEKLVPCVSDYCGIGTNVTVVGHSAGATHVAGAAFHPSFRPKLTSCTKGIILASGLYSFPYIGMSDNIRSYMGSDENDLKDRSPVTYADGFGSPLMIMASELDPREFLVSALALAGRLSQSGQNPPRLHIVPRHNHISPFLAVGTPCDELSGVLDHFARLGS